MEGLKAKQMCDYEFIGKLSEFLKNEYGIIWSQAVKDLENRDQQFI